jgi:inner membrane protein
MASIGHVMMGMAAGRLQARRRRELWGSMVLFALLSLAPDLDAIGFAMGVPYSAPWGHRGAMHSLGMAAIFGVALALLGGLVRLPPLRLGLVTFLALAGHDLADAITDGGLGVALFWPLSNHRFFLPWHPLPVAPIGLAGMLSRRGLHCITVELVAFAPFVVYALWPRRDRGEKTT